MKTMLIGAIVILVLMIGAPTVYALTDTQKEAGIASDANGIPCTFGKFHDECISALQKPYWSATPVDSSGFKQVHIIILNDVPNFGAGKTKIVLSYNSIDNYTDLTSHIINIPKPTEKNEILDAGYFIIPTSLVGDALEVGINILKEDVDDSGGTVFHGLNNTVFSVHDYYMTT